MRRGLSTLAIVILGAIAILAGPPDAGASNAFPHFVYTNDNQASNTVTGFSVAANGSLTVIGQWSTQGSGYGAGGSCQGELYASNRAKVVKHGTNGDILFALNDCSGTVSVFSGATGGALTFLTQEPLAAIGDASVASNGTCVVFGFDTGEVVSYKYPDLTAAVTTVYLASEIDGMKITKVGTQSYVVAAEPYAGQVGVVALSSKCGLGTATSITTSGGNPTDVTFGPKSAIVYVTESNIGATVVEAFAFPGGSVLGNSPYTYTVGNNSNTILATANGKCLFVANQQTSTVTAIPLTAGIPGATATAYPAGLSGTPAGMAPDSSGKFFYVASGFDNTVTTEVVGKNCALTEAPGTPLATGVGTGAFLESLTAFP